MAVKNKLIQGAAVGVLSLSWSSCKIRSDEAQPANTNIRSELSLGLALSQRDLPIAGTYSLLDKIFWKNRHGYQIPGDFGQMVWEIADATNATPIGALVPIGRSLQKHAAQPDYFKHPRILVAFRAADRSSDSSVESRLYLGYSKPANQVEIISFNEIQNRFEFQVIENFSEGNGVPKYTSRARCMTCHQGGIPIFSDLPWIEFSDTLTIGSILIQELGTNEYEGFVIDPKAPLPETSRRLIIPSALRFFEAVTLSMVAFFLDPLDFWNIVCPISPDNIDLGVNCRKDALTQALSLLEKMPSHDWNSSEIKNRIGELANSNDGMKRQYELWRKATASNRFVYERSPVIEDRSPDFPRLKREGEQYTLRTEDIANLFQLETNEMDPRKLRLESIPLESGDFALSFSKFVVKLRGVLMPDNAEEISIKLRDLPDALYSEYPNFFLTDGLNTRYLRVLVGKLTANDSINDEFIDLSLHVETKLDRSELDEAPFSNSVLRLYWFYCASCHAGADANEPNFFAETETRTFEKIWSFRDRIAEALGPRGNPRMPPDQSSELDLLNTRVADREAMIHALEFLGD